MQVHSEVILGIMIQVPSVEFLSAMTAPLFLLCSFLSFFFAQAIIKIIIGIENKGDQSSLNVMVQLLRSFGPSRLGLISLDGAHDAKRGKETATASVEEER